jgi:signal transduction histidine kinase
VKIDGTDAASVALSIHNRGAMPAAVAEQAFTPFRPGRDGRSQPGLGLGLYIVKYFVDAHHGSIALSSTQAQGTTFLIRLPRRVVPEQA